MNNIYQANSIDMIELLKELKEPLEVRGKHIKWLKHLSVTFKDNKWYQHSMKRGGLPIDFLMTFFSISKNEALDYILERFHIKNEITYQTANLGFEIPPANCANRDVITYLEYYRFIDREVIDHFISKDLIYQDKNYNNCVFVGKNENDIPVHIHLQSTHNSPMDYKGILKGSDTNYPFNVINSSNELYVFESSIDLLSYITMNKDNYKDKSYLALCGLSSKPLIHMIKTYPHLNQVFICLDNDIAGESTKVSIKNEILEHHAVEVNYIHPTYKDINDDLKQLHNQNYELGLRHNFNKKLNDLLFELKDKSIKKKLLKDIIDEFSIYLYSKDSDNYKNRMRSLYALRDSGHFALQLTLQQYTHIEESITKDNLFDNLELKNNLIMDHVDISDKQVLFISDLDFLKKELLIKKYHTKEDKIEIINTLMIFAKKAIYTHVFLTFKERNLI